MCTIDVRMMSLVDRAVSPQGWAKVRAGFLDPARLGMPVSPPTDRRAARELLHDVLLAAFVVAPYLPGPAPSPVGVSPPGRPIQVPQPPRSESPRWRPSKRRTVAESDPRQSRFEARISSRGFQLNHGAETGGTHADESFHASTTLADKFKHRTTAEIRRGLESYSAELGGGLTLMHWNGGEDFLQRPITWAWLVASTVGQAKMQALQYEHHIAAGRDRGLYVAIFGEPSRDPVQEVLAAIAANEAGIPGWFLDLGALLPALVGWLLSTYTFTGGGGPSAQRAEATLERLLLNPGKLAAAIQKDADKISTRDAGAAWTLSGLAHQISGKGKAPAYEVDEAPALRRPAVSKKVREEWAAAGRSTIKDAKEWRDMSATIRARLGEFSSGKARRSRQQEILLDHDDYGQRAAEVKLAKDRAYFPTPCPPMLVGLLSDVFNDAQAKPIGGARELTPLEQERLDIRRWSGTRQLVWSWIGEPEWPTLPWRTDTIITAPFDGSASVRFDDERHDTKDHVQTFWKAHAWHREHVWSEKQEARCVSWRWPGADSWETADERLVRWRAEAIQRERWPEVEIRPAPRPRPRPQLDTAEVMRERLSLAHLGLPEDVELGADDEISELDDDQHAQRCGDTVGHSDRRAQPRRDLGTKNRAACACGYCAAMWSAMRHTANTTGQSTTIPPDRDRLRLLTAGAQSGTIRQETCPSVKKDASSWRYKGQGGGDMVSRSAPRDSVDPASLFFGGRNVAK